MKKYFWFLIALFLAMAGLYASPADSDTAWTQDLWQLGTQIDKVMFTPDGKNIAVSVDGLNDNGGVYFLDILTGNIVKKFQKNIYSSIDFVFSSNGKTMVTTSQKFIPDYSSIAIWDTETLAPIKSLDSIALSRIGLIDDSLLIGIGKMNQSDTTRIYKININTWKIINKESAGNSRVVGDYPLAVDEIHNYFSVVTIGDNTKNVELWDLKTVKKITTLGSHNHLIQSLAFSSDGKYLASASSDGVINIWDLNSKQLLKSLIHDSLQNGYLQVIFSPKNGYLVSSGGSGSFFTKIWDMSNLKMVYQYNKPLGGSYTLDISKDSNLIATCHAYRINLLNSHWTSTGIIQQQQETYPMIFPNPSGNEITIPITQGLPLISINILNLNGIIVKTITQFEHLSNNIKVDISSLQSGAYFVSVNYPGKVVTYKFEKIR